MEGWNDSTYPFCKLLISSEEFVMGCDRKKEMLLPFTVRSCPYHVAIVSTAPGWHWRRTEICPTGGGDKPAKRFSPTLSLVGRDNMATRCFGSTLLWSLPVTSRPKRSIAKEEFGGARKKNTVEAGHCALKPNTVKVDSLTFPLVS